MQLTIDNVSKTYRGGKTALSNFSMQAGPGILGLLGPNGAGKSTLMRILATITLPTSGTVTWSGVDTARSPDNLRAVLGYLPQDFGVYGNLNAVEFLEYLAAAKGVDGRAAKCRIEELLDMVNLADAARRPLRTYSGGMKQRIGIAQALLNDPQLLIADEPTAGLDPEERLRFRNLLSELAGDRIVILSTHIVSDVETCASTIAMIARGRLLAHDSPAALLRAVEGHVWEWVVPAGDLPAVRQRFPTGSVAHRSDGVHVRVLAERSPGAGATPAAPTLEDAYLSWIAADRGERS